MSTGKPQLNRKILEREGITFDAEHVLTNNESIEILPPHVEEVRKTLLRFGKPLHMSWAPRFHRHYHNRLESPIAGLKNADRDLREYTVLPPESAYRTTDPAEPPEDEAEKELRMLAVVNRYWRIAVRLSRREHDAEADLANFLTHEIFRAPEFTKSFSDKPE